MTRKMKVKERRKNHSSGWIVTSTHVTAWFISICTILKSLEHTTTNYY
jgi:hypothetical protein